MFHEQGVQKPGYSQINGRSVRVLVMRILKEEGIAGFYRGFGATMLKSFSMRTPLSSTCPAFRLNHTNTEYAYFFYSLAYTSCIKCLATRNPPGASSRLSTVAELSLGAVAGALVQIFTIPQAVFATPQQLDAPKGKGTWDMSKA